MLINLVFQLYREMLVGKQKIPEKPAISNLVKEVLVQVEKITDQCRNRWRVLRRAHG